MTARRRRISRYAVAFLAGVVVAGVVSVALGASPLFVTSNSDGTQIYSARPTGVGLPLVGATGTQGAGEYSSALKSYHDSGAYGEDLKTVDDQARTYLGKRVRKLRKAAKKRCRRAHHRGASGAALERACTKPRPALVLDIDETSLSNYANLSATNFSGATGALAIGVIAGNEPVIRPTLDLFNFARSQGVFLFFITGRPSDIPLVATQTQANLLSAGYSNWKGLEMKPSSEKTLAFKSGKRAEIESSGFHIVANVGDQESDLEGGHADRAFKLPNPFYFIGDS